METMKKENELAWRINQKAKNKNHYDEGNRLMKIIGNF
jgi:hypothetical protein